MHREEFSEKLSVHLSETSAVLCEAESFQATEGAEVTQRRIF
jgi:hypothetical protein